MSVINKTRSKQELVQEIEEALESVNFGSIEIYVQDSRVTQITVRNIKKTSIEITQESSVTENQKDQKVFAVHSHFRRTE